MNERAFTFSVAWEQALLFGRVKRVSHASERRSPNRRACAQATFSVTFSLPSPSSDLDVPNDCRTARKAFPCCVDVVVNFLSQLICIFPLFLGMVMYANEFKTKKKQKLTKIKN